MTILELKHVSFQYPGQKKEALKNISFKVSEGEILYVCGPTGAGKSTLLHCLKREIRPLGEMQGEITFCGSPMDSFSKEDLVSQIGIVFQNPDNQTVMDTVMSEMTFGLENLGLPPAEIKQRLSEIAGFFGIEPLFNKSYQHLSGGERQTVNLCAVLAMRPKLLLLDEPISQLDPVAQAEFTGILRRLSDEFGITIIINEHKNTELMTISNKVLFLDEGELHYFGTPRDIASQIILNNDHKALSFLPAPVRLFAAAEGLPISEMPLTIKEARKMVNNNQIFRYDQNDENDENASAFRNPNQAISAENLLFSYRSSPGEMVLKHLDFQAFQGDFIGIVGGNGSGKSTLMKLFCGLASPLDGTIRLGNEKINKMKRSQICDQVFYIPQNPLTYFTCDTVSGEIDLAAQKGKAYRQGYEALLAKFRLSSLLKLHPYDLSGGERQKVLIVCAILRDVQILLLDEATKGLDSNVKKDLGEMLGMLSNAGKTIIMVSHDLEFIASYAKKCALIFDGNLSLLQNTRGFFANNYFYTTAAKRIFRDTLPLVLTIEEVRSHGLS